ncbi:hypothetical protein MMC14_007981 [Varicellaria rhodocarpa]|nr:hypothetical protein [Varicellaria rhodocarpa]
MPPWGRPSGARKDKRRKDWKRQQQWEEQRRFEEINSESDDGQGVVLGDSFVSDELYFTGADLGYLARDERNHDYSDSSEGSEDRDEMDERDGSAMQVAIRDKEEKLVQRALERIRRAQSMGKTSVKLSQPEIDALERKRQKDQAKARKPVAKTMAGDKRHSGKRQSTSSKTLPITTGRRRSKTSLSQHGEGTSTIPGVNLPPGFVIAGPDGKPVYTPIGSHTSTGSPYGPSSRPGSRSGSSHSLHIPHLPQTQYRNQQKRFFSVPEQHFSSSSRNPPSPRIPIDEPSRSSRSRSTSVSQSHTPDPHLYRSYSPDLAQLPIQYAQGRRNMSNPTGVPYPNVRSPVPLPRVYASSSDPSLLRREYSGGNAYQVSGSDDDMDDDDDDNGVQVDVRAYSQGFSANSNGSGGRQRKGRR